MLIVCLKSRILALEWLGANQTAPEILHRSAAEIARVDPLKQEIQIVASVL